MNGKSEAVGKGDKNAAARGAVKLGHDQAGDARDPQEGFDLVHGVLAPGGIEHQKGGMGSREVLFSQDTDDLLKLRHQIGLVVQPAGSVDDQYVGAAVAGGVESVEGDAGSVGARGAGEDLRADAVTPNGQLLDRGGAEGVAGGEHHAETLAPGDGAELSDGGGLAGTIDADDENDERPFGLVEDEGGLDGFQDFGDLVGQNTLDRIGGDLAVVAALGYR